MRTVKAFVDTSTVNRILDIKVEKPEDRKWEEDKLYLIKIKEDYVDEGTVQFFVNPSVEIEIENTDEPRKSELLNKFRQFRFTSYNVTVFPFRFPAQFLTEEATKVLEELANLISGFERNRKIFADAFCNKDILLFISLPPLISTFQGGIKGVGESIWESHPRLDNWG